MKVLSSNIWVSEPFVHRVGDGGWVDTSEELWSPGSKLWSGTTSAKQMSTLLIHIIYLSKNKKLTQHTAIILVILNNDIIIINSIVRNDIFFISS